MLDDNKIYTSLTQWKKQMNTYIKHSILKPYLIHVEFELENIKGKIKTDKYLRRIIKIRGFDVRSFELDMITAIQKIRELQKMFKRFDI